MAKTIVLIHGMFVNNLSWALWKQYYEQIGFTVYAPSNPGHNGDPAFLRANIHPDLENTGFIDVVKHIEHLIDSLPEKPIVIGHSMAGLVVQKLVELGKVDAGISINGAPPKNVFPPLSTIKIVWPAVDFFSKDGYYLGTRDWYNRAFFNTLPEAEQVEAYNANAVPESRKTGRETLLKSFSNIKFKKTHAPILFIGGGKDNIFPPSLTKKIAAKYKDRKSRVDVKIYDDKSHFICGENGWEDIANYILHWHSTLKKPANI